MWRLRQTVVYELSALGSPLAITKIRNLVRALQHYGLPNLEAMTATFSSVEALRAGLVWTELPANANFAKNGDPMLAPMDITAVVQLGKALE